MKTILAKKIKKKPQPTEKSPVSATPKPVLVDGEIRVLEGLSWLETVTALHQRVREEMPEGQRHFLLPKPAEYFADLLTGKTGTLLGVMAGEELAGFAAVLHLKDFAAAHASGRLTFPDPDNRLATAFAEGPVGVIQSMCVLNKWMGRGFSRTLVQAYIAWGASRRCAHLFAQIADQNILSWMRFLDQSFAIITTWESGHRRLLLRHMSPQERAARVRRVTDADLQAYRKDCALIPALLAQLRARLEEGRIVFLAQDSALNGSLRFVSSKLCLDKPATRRPAASLSAHA